MYSDVSKTEIRVTDVKYWSTNRVSNSSKGTDADVSSNAENPVLDRCSS